MPVGAIGACTLALWMWLDKAFAQSCGNTRSDLQRRRIRGLLELTWLGCSARTGGAGLSQPRDLCISEHQMREDDDARLVDLLRTGQGWHWWRVFLQPLEPSSTSASKQRTCVRVALYHPVPTAISVFR